MSDVNHELLEPFLKKRKRLLLFYIICSYASFGNNDTTDGVINIDHLDPGIYVDVVLISITHLNALAQK